MKIIKKITLHFWLCLLVFSTLFTALPASPAVAVGCIPAPPQAISWWPGDGNANDIAGGHNGTLQGTATYAAGKVGQAFSFDGAGSVEVADDPGWTFNSDFSVDLWVNFNSLTGLDPFIAHTEGGGLTNKWIFWYNTSGHDKLLNTPALRFAVNSTSASPHDAIVSEWHPTTGRWYHVAVTRSGDVFNLYIDGQKVKSETSPYALNDQDAPLTIGKAEAFNLDGMVDEVEIHNRALADQEIANIYTAGSAGKCKAITVNIDIKPGSYPNKINLGSHGTVPVAVRGGPDFDASTVDPTSITLAGAQVHLTGKGTPAASLYDLNEDNYPDLLVHVETEALQISESSSEVILKGYTYGSMPIIGTDSVQVVP